jgi:hypothetical protein
LRRQNNDTISSLCRPSRSPRLVVSKRALAELAALPEAETADVIAAIESTPAALGRPHLHAGLELRQLHPGIYEGRSRLRWRFVFEREGGSLVIKTVGNHDDIRRWLRQRL